MLHPVLRLSVVALAWLTIGLESAVLGDESDPEWGPIADGLQARVVVVAPEPDEQAPDFDAAERVNTFARPEQLTLLIEVKNVGDEPMVVQGVRNDDRMSHAGQSNSDHFGPLIFRCEFFDAAGKAIVGPANEVHAGDAAMVLSGASASTLAPGDSLVALLRPGKWDASVIRQIAAGDYTVRVHYCGPSEDVRATAQRARRTWPPARAWSGNVVAGDASFTISREPVAAWREPVWGEPVDGLRAAVELTSAAETPKALVDTASSTFPYGSRIKVQYLVENVSDRAITFWSENWRQGDGGTLLDAEGKEITGSVAGSFSTGWSTVRHWTLQPREIAVLRAIDVGVAADEEGAKAYDHPFSGMVFAQPGEYGLQYTLRFGGWRRRSREGEEIPGPDDWQGTLTTGVAPLAVRERGPEDAAP
jgi:hypothetical protein